MQYEKIVLNANWLPAVEVVQENIRLYPAYTVNTLKC